MASNILYLHSHDTGRFVQPYGANVNTPNLMAFAKQAIVYRNMWAAAPVCSGSRASLLTGQYPHSNGMMGLAHRGWKLFDYQTILPVFLKDNGYVTAVFGEQHISQSLDTLGYDHASEVSSKDPEIMTDAVEEYLASVDRSKPFFLSVGYWQTHRTSFQDAVQQWDFTKTVAHLPDVPQTREDWGRYQRSVELLDVNMGRVLKIIQDHPNTIVIVTTDHGISVPGAKATLHDLGLGIMCMISGPNIKPMVCEQQVSNIDVYPTMCSLVGLPAPSHCQGQVLPLNKEDRSVGLTFAELTFHAAYDPQRTVRDQRFRLIRRYRHSDEPVWPNVDDSVVKDLLHDSGWSDRGIGYEELFDTLTDPGEHNDLVDDPKHQSKLLQLQQALDHWQQTTNDPLRFGTVDVPDAVIGNTEDQYSAEQETSPIKEHILPPWHCCVDEFKNNKY